MRRTTTAAIATPASVYNTTAITSFVFALLSGAALPDGVVGLVALGSNETCAEGSVWAVSGTGVAVGAAGAAPKGSSVWKSYVFASMSALISPIRASVAFSLSGVVPR